MSLSSVVRRLWLLAWILTAFATDLAAQGKATFASASPYFGAYFGTFENGGRWGMAVSWDSFARFDFIGRVGNGFAARSYLYPSEFYEGGRFGGFTPPHSEIAGSITNGAVIGSAAGYAFHGQIDHVEGSGSAYRGYYRWSDWRQPFVTSTTVEAIVGPSGTTLVLLKAPNAGDEDGLTTIATDGTFALTLTGGTRVSARIDSGTAKLEATVFREGVPFANEGRIVNLSLLGSGAEGASRFGFTVAGGTGKRVLFRAIGSQLSTILGPGAYLLDPVIEVGQGPTLIAANDDWDVDDPELRRAMAQVGALSLVKGSKDAAFIGTLSPGNYWLNVHSADLEAVGKVLVEIFDLEPNNGSLLNFSAQGYAGRGRDELISGFVISGDQPRSVLVRAVGPGAVPPGGYNPAPLVDPQLEVRNSAGIIVAANDNWSSLDSPLIAATQKAGTFQLDPGSENAALLVTLAPGAYTATVRGAAGGTGNALVEIDDSALVPPATKAKLVIDAFTVKRVPDGNYFNYLPRLHLAETGGASTAFVTTVIINIDEAGARSTPSWPASRLVPAGGTLDLIQELYGEPEFYVSSSLAAEIVSATITYRDRDGREDSISALARVTQ